MSHTFAPLNQGARGAIRQALEPASQLPVAFALWLEGLKSTTLPLNLHLQYSMFPNVFFLSIFLYLKLKKKNKEVQLKKKVCLEAKGGRNGRNGKILACRDL